ncbi:hypothetical protein C0Q70_00644 [Pomacea canaliculata]|uniref:Uncharacterized protein n=1 Tax=Pomacea canaliculata TaxID=400727 RepID=A0A2T7PX90_POMCA|nr:hypothetical protein C0Q70_00644 [Pomacea canaliculata]
MSSDETDTPTNLAPSYIACRHCALSANRNDARAVIDASAPGSPRYNQRQWLSLGGRGRVEGGRGGEVDEVDSCPPSFSPHSPTIERPPRLLFSGITWRGNERTGEGLARTPKRLSSRGESDDHTWGPIFLLLIASVCT